MNRQPNVSARTYSMREVPKDEGICFVCCCKKAGHIPVLMEIGGTWISSQHIPIWWIVFRLLSMLYLIFSVALNIYVKFIDKGYGFWFYFYYLTSWGNIVAMLSAIIKFASTVEAWMVVKANNRSSLCDDGQYKKWFICQKILLWTSLPALTLVAMLYWVLLYHPHYTDLSGLWGFVSINNHSITLVPVVIDFILSSERYFYKNVVWPIGFGSAYLLWTVLFEAFGLEAQDGSTYLYRYINWSEDAVLASIISCMAIALAFAVSVTYAACKKCILHCKEEEEDVPVENESEHMSVL